MATSEIPSSSASPTPRSGPSQSSNLYLVTFLATLFLLLFVSCAIVLRSYILRRRYQRRLDDAMAAGMVLTPRAQGSKRKRFGAKPKMTDKWIVRGGEKWDSITPLCAQSVFVKRKYRDGQGPRATGITDHTIAVLADTSETLTSPPETFSHRLSKIFDRSPTPADNVQLTSPAPTGTYKVRVEMLQVSVLVAMPSLTHTIRKNARLDRADVNAITYHDSGDESDDEEGAVLPELVFGVARVNYPKPSTKEPDTDVLDTAPTLVDVGL